MSIMRMTVANRDVNICAYQCVFQAYCAGILYTPAIP